MSKMITLNLKIKGQDIEFTIEEACELRDELGRLLSGYMSETERQAGILSCDAKIAAIEASRRLDMNLRNTGPGA